MSSREAALDLPPDYLPLERVSFLSTVRNALPRKARYLNEA